ncbi:MAG TPA: hypothetical protein VGB76_06795 [Pyrinomonadaceae bacterium]
MLFSIVVPVVFGYGSAQYAQGGITQKVMSIEQKQQATDATVDANKREGAEQLKDLRKEVVTKEVLDEKWKTVDKMDRKLDELLRLQLKELR